MQNTELDWFEFETRMRSIFSQLIQPLMKISSDNSSEIEILKKKSENYSKRIQFTETIIGTSDKKIGWVKEIESSLNNLTVELKLLETNFNQKIFEINEKTQISQTSIKQIETSLQSYAKQMQIIENGINNSQDAIKNTNSALNTYFQKTKEDLANKSAEIFKMTNECLKLSDHAMKKVLDLNTKTNESFQIIDKIRLMMREQSLQMIQLFHEKSATEDFIKFTKNIESKIENYADKVRILENKLKETFRYLDLYLPFDIQVYISDNLYSVLKKRSLKVWMRFEDQRRKEIQKKIATFENENDISDLLKCTLNSIKQFENRKNDIYFKMIKRRADEYSSDEEKNEKKRKLGSLTMRIDPVPNLGLQIDNEVIQEVLSIKSTFNSMQEAIKDITKTQSHMKNFLENLKTDNKVHFQVIEDSLKSFHKDEDEKNAKNGLFFVEKLDNYKHKLKNLYDAIVNLSELVSNIVEFCLVTNGILDQEEKDKKSFQNQGSDLHLPSVSRKQSSFAGNEFLSGKGLLLKPTPSFVSTSLKYKNVVYTREEIIELVGKKISKAWTEASSKPPFLAKSLKKKSDSKKLNSTLNLSYSGNFDS